MSSEFLNAFTELGAENECLKARIKELENAIIHITCPYCDRISDWVMKGGKVNK